VYDAAVKKSNAEAARKHRRKGNGEEYLPRNTLKQQSQAVAVSNFIDMYAELTVVKKLKIIRKMFENLHKQHPSRKLALDIVDYLLLNGLDKYCEPEKMDFITPPTTAELWKDLEGHDEFYDGIEGVKAEKMNDSMFIKNWSNMHDYGNPMFSNYTPYSAFNIVCQSKAGVYIEDKDYIYIGTLYIDYIYIYNVPVYRGLVYFMYIESSYILIDNHLFSIRRPIIRNIVLSSYRDLGENIGIPVS
jgi:hypothetical protein